jgi:protein-disulfide isomerase
MDLLSQRSIVVRPRFPSKLRTASIDVIQYGDYECLDCGRAAITLQSLRQRLDHRIRFSYRHFPLASIHPHATQAAEAAECARAQGRFWKMHDLLMANQDRLELQHIYDYAEQAGLDMPRFDTEMDDEVHLPTIHSQMAGGISNGVIRTPAFLVDGILLDSTGGLRALYQATETAGSQGAVAHSIQR